MCVFVFAFTSEYAAQKIKAKAGFALDAFFSSSMPCSVCCLEYLNHTPPPHADRHENLFQKDWQFRS